MKDKRQRIAVAWPYAAVYADPAFAASLLQAAANSVNMPYYAPNPMMSQMPVIVPSQIPSAMPNHYTYSCRYLPYQIPHRNSTGLSPPSQSSPMSTYPNGTIFNRGMLGNGLCSDYLPSPASPLSPLSLSPVSESDKVNTKHLPWSERRVSWVVYKLIWNYFQILPVHNSKQNILHYISHQNDNNIGETTTIIKTDKPKLFKPYNSEGL